MRTLCIGDIHIDESNRLNDLEAILNQITLIVKDRTIEKVMFFGDLFTSRRPTPLEYKVAYKFVMELKKYCDSVILLKGNHDLQKDASTLDAFDILNISNVKVVENGHVEDEIYMGHYVLQEAIIGSSDIHINGAITLDQLFKAHPGYRAYLFGDVHKEQIVNEKPFVAYIGAVMKNNFGERQNSPRVLLINKDWSFESIPLNDRPMKQFDWEYADVEALKTRNFTGYKVLDTIVKVVISGSSEELAKVEAMRQEIRDVFSTAHSLSIQYNVINKDIVRDSKINADMDEESVLQYYLNKKRDDLDNETKATTLEIGKEIFNKSKETK